MNMGLLGNTFLNLNTTWWALHSDRLYPFAVYPFYQLDWIASLCAVAKTVCGFQRFSVWW
jgi:hypothetical protein